MHSCQCSECYLSDDASEDHGPKDVEIARLTRKNALLQDSIDDLKLEIAQLKEENIRQRNLVQTLNGGRRPFRQPPPEILGLIFSFVLPPSFLLDPSVFCGPDSPWCQATSLKMGLTNVCRAWYGPAVGMLYKDVAFRSIGQLSALLRTVKSHTAYGPLIRKIGVHCIIPRGCGGVFEADLKDLVERTPNVTSVVLKSPWPSPPPVPKAFDHISWPITHIDFGSTSYSDLHPYIGHLSPSLVSLSIQLPLDLPSHNPYTLGRLQSLRCFVASPSDPAPVSALPLLAERLILPRLNTFLLQLPSTSDLERSNQIRHCATFCKLYSKTLRTVDLQPFRIGWEDSFARGCSEQITSAVQDLLDACPHLEHLILPSSLVTDRGIFELSHPKIEWIDFWTLRRSRKRQCVIHAVDTKNFAALKGVRKIMLSANILFAHIPTDIPPHLNLEEPFEFDFPGVFLRHGHGRIYRCDALDSISEDGLVLNSNSEEDDDASSCDTWGSDDSAVGSEELSGDEWEADHEDVLVIYDQLESSQ
ncbi:hypothetical protein FB45DRAFT_204785 [Roridomyces roridus]|uniref:F-box domain-containing protein n=1 Tax=Roridomyces roridus TaxID=1738132 RepID=A0AAD7FX37_9AGAR|nr:hypothetical protein FB45DRAFT_204785 [Roridomyces roridus]